MKQHERVASEEVIARMRRLSARRRVRHAVVAVESVDGAWAWSDAAGEATPEGRPMRATTPWLLASITKLHVATVVLRLHERGALDLDAPVSAYLPPELARGLHVLDGVDHTERITVTHLLGHLTGLPDVHGERPRGGRSLIEEVLEGGDRAWSAEEAVARARDRLRPHFAPSEPHAARPRIRYSDTNFLLLMVIAEYVTGRPMGALYRELLFEALGLAHTWFPGDEPLQPAGEPATVWLGDRPFVDRPLATRSFGDLYSTAGDVLRFGRALFTGAVFDDPSTLELMLRRFHRFGLPRSAATLQAPSWPIEYGLGVMRFAPSRALTGGRRLPAPVGHTGSTGSWLWHCPQLGLMLAGTVDQAVAATVPFRAGPKALAGLAE